MKDSAQGWFVRGVLVLLTFGIACLAFAQQPASSNLEGDSSGRANARASRAAEIVLFNRPIVRLRATFLGVPPDERARVAEARIADLLDRGGPGKVTTELAPQGTVFKIDGALAFVLVREDVDPVGGESLETVVPLTVSALERAIAETREARSGRLMLAAALWSIGATFVYVSMLSILWRLGRLMMGASIRFARDTSRRLRLGGGEVLQRERLVTLVRSIVYIAGWALAIALTYTWMRFVLGRFPYTRVWSEQLASFTGDAALGLLNSMARAAPDLLIVLLIVVAARWVAGSLGHFFDNVRADRIRLAWVDSDTAQPTKRLVIVLVWVFALVMAYPYIPGSGSEAFKGLSVLIGLMVSLGGSGIVGQAGSGLILLYSRTLRHGEYVRIGDHEGTVVELRSFVTRIRTGLGEELTLPNSMVLANAIKNYSRTTKGVGYIVDTTVTIGYDTPWRQVHAILVEAALRTQGVVSEPSPRVFQTALSDFYVEYRLVCQATPRDAPSRADVLTALHQHVQDVFNEYGVQIMSPHYLGDPSNAKVVPPASWYTPPARS